MGNLDNNSDNNKIIFAGGGGHALSLLEALDSDSEVFGYLAPSAAPMMPLEYLGNDSDAPEYIADGYPFHIAFVYARLPIMDKRRALISRYEEMGAEFKSIIAPYAIITRNSVVGNGVAILNRAIINRATISDHCIINTGAIVEHDCKIGSNTFIGPGVVIGGGVTIGDDCFIGLGTKIKNGITIGSRVTIAMGAVVTRNLTEPGIYHGTPLKRFKL